VAEPVFMAVLLKKPKQIGTGINARNRYKE
jgi:hypothetical protein